MKQFMEPELKVEIFHVEDIITGSIVNPDDDPTPGPNGSPIG